MQELLKQVTDGSLQSRHDHSGQSLCAQREAMTSTSQRRETLKGLWGTSGIYGPNDGPLKHSKESAPARPTAMCDILPFSSPGNHDRDRPEITGQNVDFDEDIGHDWPISQKSGPVMPCNDRSVDLPLLHTCCEEASASSWRCAYAEQLRHTFATRPSSRLKLLNLPLALGNEAGAEPPLLQACAISSAGSQPSRRWGSSSPSRPALTSLAIGSWRRLASRRRLWSSIADCMGA